MIKPNDSRGIRNFELVYAGGKWCGEDQPGPVMSAILLGVINAKPEKLVCPTKPRRKRGDR